MAYPRQKDFPTKIMLGGKDVHVIWGGVTSDENGHYQSDGETRIIRIRRGLKPQVRFNIFIHEMMHALEEIYNIEVPHKLVDKLSDLLSIGIEAAFDIKKKGS